MFVLAVALGKTVGELQRSLTPTELAEWMAFYKLYPFGEEAMDWRISGMQATLAQTVAKKGKTYQAKQFLPFKRRWEPLPKSREELVNKLKRVFGVKGKKSDG